MKLWDWTKIDEIVASFARPYQQYACSSAIAFGTVWSVVTHSNDVAITVFVTACAGLAGNAAILRTLDKKTAATADVAKTVGAANASVSP
tara:strand:+ start:65 stop:334 length:270 start_codon:yes stop_codon:yes gene_type:complete